MIYVSSVDRSKALMPLATLVGAALAAGGALALPAASHAANRYGSADTGVISVSSEPANSDGEEPLAVNPLNPKQITAVANVFEPEFPPPLNPFVGGGGLQDTRIFSSQ